MDEAVRCARGAKRVRAYLRGELVADTRDPWYVWELPYYPAYYLPAADVRAELVDTGGTHSDERLGEARVYDVRAGGARATRAARRYPDPPLDGLVRLDWNAMDEWLEEDEPVYTHPRDPYSRIDILDSSRHVRVEVDGQTVAESTHPKILYETGLPPRYYLPLPDIRLDLLRPSATRSHCPYKGTSGYWSVEVGGRLHEDLAWEYRTPLPECLKIAGLVCFYAEKLDVFVDGERQDTARHHPEA